MRGCYRKRSLVTLVIGNFVKAESLKATEKLCRLNMYDSNSPERLLETPGRFEMFLAFDTRVRYGLETAS